MYPVPQKALPPPCLPRCHIHSHGRPRRWRYCDWLARGQHLKEYETKSEMATFSALCLSPNIRFEFIIGSHLWRVHTLGRCHLSCRKCRGGPLRLRRSWTNRTLSDATPSATLGESFLTSSVHIRSICLVVNICFSINY